MRRSLPTSRPPAAAGKSSASSRSEAAPNDRAERVWRRCAGLVPAVGRRACPPARIWQRSRDRSLVGRGRKTERSSGDRLGQGGPREVGPRRARLPGQARVRSRRARRERPSEDRPGRERRYSSGHLARMSGHSVCTNALPGCEPAVADQGRDSHDAERAHARRRRSQCGSAAPVVVAVSRHLDHRGARPDGGRSSRSPASATHAGEQESRIQSRQATFGRP
jgi:hypothetical protein